MVSRTSFQWTPGGLYTQNRPSNLRTRRMAGVAIILSKWIFPGICYPFTWCNNSLSRLNCLPDVWVVLFPPDFAARVVQRKRRCPSVSVLTADCRMDWHLPDWMYINNRSLFYTRLTTICIYDGMKKWWAFCLFIKGCSHFLKSILKWRLKRICYGKNNPEVATVIVITLARTFFFFLLRHEI